MPTPTFSALAKLPHRWQQPRPNREFLHATNEFSAGVQFMSEIEQKPQEAHVGDLVKELVLALQNQARTRPHPLLYVNLGFVLTLAFWSGVQWQRVNTIESTVTRYPIVESITARIDALNNQMGEVRGEMTRTRDRLERFMDDHNKGK